MRDRNLMLAVLAGALSAPAIGGDVAVIQRGGFGALGGFSELAPRRSAYRQGRRFTYGRGPVRKGGNPAGTKLARMAAEGKLTIVRIR